GHIHLPFVLPLHECLVDVPRPMWAVQAGTAVSWRVRAGHPNSVNVVRRDDGAHACMVERWDYAAERQAFVLADAVRLSLASAAAPL
ncbi:metallophosphoesterase, partial [Variovorax sp. CT11-76]